jgi:hypothetical protein
MSHYYQPPRQKPSSGTVIAWVAVGIASFLTLGIIVLVAVSADLHTDSGPSSAPSTSVVTNSADDRFLTDLAAHGVTACGPDLAAWQRESIGTGHQICGMLTAAPAYVAKRTVEHNLVRDHG